MPTSLEASIDIAASPDAVWKIVSDLRRMGEWSPQCKMMRVLGGDVRTGTRTININKRGLLVWPTTSTVVEFTPNSKLAFRVNENKAIWSYTLDATATGTTLTERRDSPSGSTGVSTFLIDKVMGSTAGFDEELVDGMKRTLQKIKSFAEQS